jgi:hypothetical protein
MHCRICFGEENLIELLCNCKDDLAYIHYDCAKKWYTGNLDVVFKGKLKERMWSVWATANCEICKEYINNQLTAQLYRDHEKKIKN